MTTSWIKSKISTHWKNFNKTKTFVYRNFENNTVTIDFGNGGRCASYTYDGKWIAG